MDKDAPKRVDCRTKNVILDISNKKNRGMNANWIEEKRFKKRLNNKKNSPGW